MRSRALRSVLAALVAVPLVLGFGTPGASAGVVDLTCPLAATINFTPGLTVTSQSVQITGTATAGTSVSPGTPCSSATGVPYTGASGPVSGTGTLGCVTVGFSGLTGSASGTLPVTWNNSDRSTITWSVTIGGAAPAVTASVTAGKLKGSTVTVVAGPNGLNGNCADQLTTVDFVGTVEFSRT